MRDRKALKEQVLADARKKIGISEEKREEFKKRKAEANARREKKAAEMKGMTAK